MPSMRPVYSAPKAVQGGETEISNTTKPQLQDRLHMHQIKQHTHTMLQYKLSDHGSLNLPRNIKLMKNLNSAITVCVNVSTDDRMTSCIHVQTVNNLCRWVSYAHSWHDVEYMRPALASRLGLPQNLFHDVKYMRPALASRLGLPQNLFHGVEYMRPALASHLGLPQNLFHGGEVQVERQQSTLSTVTNVDCVVCCGNRKKYLLIVTQSIDSLFTLGIVYWKPEDVVTNAVWAAHVLQVEQLTVGVRRVFVRLTTNIIQVNTE